MKKKHSYKAGKKVIEREYNYIPVRYIVAVMITIFEVVSIIGILGALCYFVPYFYLAAWATEIFCVIKIIASNDNPEYKLPWLLFVLILPVVGFMLYFIFYSRSFSKKYVRRLKKLYDERYPEKDEENFKALSEESEGAYNQAKLLCSLSGGHLFRDTKQTYFRLGEEMWQSLLADLQRAEKFIYMEYFIIEEGVFWNSILEILKQKAAAGLDVRVVFDDVGCMSTLPGNYAKQLGTFGIKATPFSRLKGQANNEFNNRSHRKITVIDGIIGYTGGVNIADEYVNKTQRFGHWKDVGIRLEGVAVYELTKLFLIDFGLNVKELPINPDAEILFPKTEIQEQGYLIPFGDGPRPMYPRRVAQSLLVDMLANAKRYAYMMTPYLIIDNDMCLALENAAIKGVDVRIIVPHIPDKKLVFEMTKTFYERLMKAGVKIYEYESGFVHAKCYLFDDEAAMIGTINLDYRSLVHHFENGVWLYKAECLQDVKEDMLDTMDKSIEILPENVKTNILQRTIRAIVRIFAPML
ncbi:MAG: cardiolipin synthase [Clostridia bacterium]|nr:cardiolipin synthase [Clostridia bacterium]